MIHPHAVSIGASGNILPRQAGHPADQQKMVLGHAKDCMQRSDSSLKHAEERNRRRTSTQIVVQPFTDRHAIFTAPTREVLRCKLLDRITNGHVTPDPVVRVQRRITTDPSLDLGLIRSVTAKEDSFIRARAGIDRKHDARREDHAVCVVQAPRAGVSGWLNYLGCTQMESVESACPAAAEALTQKHWSRVRLCARRFARDWCARSTWEVRAGTTTWSR